MNPVFWVVVWLLGGLAQAVSAAGQPAATAIASATAVAATNAATVAYPDRLSADRPRLIPAMSGRPDPRLRLVPGTVFKDCVNCPEMAVVPAGWFIMGASPGEEERVEVDSRYRRRSQPQHRVTIEAPFAIGRAEVTRAEFARFVAATGHRAEGCWVRIDRLWQHRADRNWRSPGFEQSDQDPVVCVSWLDAKAYSAWLSAETRQTYRLLTEPEWESGARAGSATARWWGEEIGRNQANCRGCGSRWDGRRTAPAGSFDDNRFNLFDMLGNASEWVEDCWFDDHRGAPSDGRARTRRGCKLRVIRGGNWDSGPETVRAAHRLRDVQTMRLFTTGFRLARVLEPLPGG